MRNPVLLAILGVVVFLQTGCAVGATVTRPRLPTIIVGELPPPPPEPEYHPVPQRPQRPAPPPRVLARGEAIAIGQQWCRANRYDCHLDEAKLKRGEGVWKLEFDTYGNRGRGHGKGRRKNRGEVEMRIDAWSGHIRGVEVKR